MYTNARTPADRMFPTTIDSSANERSETIMELPQRQQQAETSIEAPPVIPEHAVETESTSPSPQQLLKLLSAGFSFFVAGANDGCLGALIPYMLTTYSIPPSFISLLYLATFLGWFLAALANSHAPKYLQLGTLLSLGAVLQLLSQVLRAWTPPFGLFAVTFFLTGLGQAFQDSFSNTFVSTVKGAHRWLGFVHAMYGFGLLVSPFVATAIAGNGARRWELFYLFPLGLSVMNLGLVIVSFWDSFGIVRQSEASEGDTGRNKNAWKEMRQMLKMKDLWVLSLFFFFFLGVGTTSGGWVVEYLVRIRHGDVKEMGYVPAGFYGGLCVGRLVLVEPTHCFGERRMLLLYCILCFSLQLVFWLVPNIVSTIAMFSLIGFLIGPFFAAGVSVASKLFPKQIQPAALGFVFVVAQAGAAIFPSLIGLITSRAGIQVLPPIVAGLIAATGISWAFVPKVSNEHSD